METGIDKSEFSKADEKIKREGGADTNRSTVKPGEKDTRVISK